MSRKPGEAPLEAIRARTERSRATYDEEIAKHGKVVRVEDWIDSQTSILHRCLTHGEEHKASPSAMKKGQGLKCCKQASRLEVAARKSAEAAARYDERIAVHGKVKRLEPYVKNNVKILHECLIHGEQGLLSPMDALVGKSIPCCKHAKHLERVAEQKAQAKKDFYASMAQRDDIEVLEEYVDSETPILFKCLKHDELHRTSPRNPLRKNNTGGFACCRNVLAQEVANRRKAEAAKTYDQRLAEFGRLVRVGEYVGNNKPTLHRCLAHDEEHEIRPSNALKGQGILCCNRGIGWDTLDRVLEGKTLKSATDKGSEFYMFRVPEQEGWFKLGISVNSHQRAKHSKLIYGEMVTAWELSNRINAVLIENAVLRDKSFDSPATALSHLVGEKGFTEIRQADEDHLIEHVQRLVDSLEEDPDNWAAWALQNMPHLWKWERKRLEELAGEVDT